MMARTYPNLASIRSTQNKSEFDCEFCGSRVPPKKQEVIIKIETSWFRGDDSYYHACQKCAGKYQHLRKKLGDRKMMYILFANWEKQNPNKYKE
jgi:DNA-directed RNA polymerase subunit RPC12/RpoP